MGTSGITPKGKETFDIANSEASYSRRDRCMYLAKAKTFPGQITFTQLGNEHKKIFRGARAKELQSLLDTKSITILSKKESEEFRRNYPEGVLGSKFVDRWKPSGKFAVLPEEYGNPNFDPAKHEGLAAKSRWCVVGWQDPSDSRDREIGPHTDNLIAVPFLPASSITKMGSQSEGRENRLPAVNANHEEETFGVHHAQGRSLQRLQRRPVDHAQHGSL